MTALKWEPTNHPNVLRASQDGIRYICVDCSYANDRSRCKPWLHATINQPSALSTEYLTMDAAKAVCQAKADEIELQRARLEVMQP